MVDPPRRLAAALAGVGALLCVLGWYQISGQATVAQQLPYLASATIPGAALLAVGVGLALRTPWPSRGRERADVTPSGDSGSGDFAPGGGLLRVPDGRYVHTPDCPLLDGRTDVLPALPVLHAETVPESASESAEQPALRPCPLCHAAYHASTEH